MRGDFLTNGHIVNGVYPVADAFASSATTDYVSLENYQRVGWIIHTGDATAGTANGTVTVLGATAAAGTNATATTFSYRSCASSTSVDTWGSQTAATSSGFSMSAGDNYLYWCEATSEEIAAAYTGATFAALKVTEVTNDPIVAGIITVLLDPGYPQAVPVSAIA